MIAFAANSLLNRLALAEGAIGPGGFAMIRMTTGVVVLILLLIARDRRAPRPVKPQLSAVAGLTIYMLGFSFAYVAMDAGLGALILFAGVQVTMFIGALLGDDPPLRRAWAGMALALTGLAILTFPKGPVVIDTGALLLMACASVGWGMYSLAGRRVRDPLSATCWNFLFSLPLVLGALLFWPDTTGMTGRGVLLAMVSGGVTSAMGYALWYSILPSLGATKGAIAQLSAPVIALGLGALLLNETITWTAVGATVLILGGVGIGVMPKGKRSG